MPLTTRVSGKAVGIVGMGRIGAAVARRLAGFDADIAYFAPQPPRRAPWPSLTISLLSRGGQSS